MAYSLINDIYIGSVSNPAYHYSNRSIVLNSLNGVFTVDTIGNELSIDTFSFQVRYNPNADLVYAPRGKDGYKDTNGKIYRLNKSNADKIYNIYAPIGKDGYEDTNDKIYRFFTGQYSADRYLTDVPFGTPVFWYVSGSFFAKGYTKTIERVSKYCWKITCISGIGLLDTKNHVGGIYDGVPLLTIARSIIGNAFSFTCDTLAGNTLVYGHLPYDKARNNLHRLLFAAGAVMVRGSAGNDYVIRFLEETKTRVPDSRIAINGSVVTQLPATRVEVTEHSYYAQASDEEVKLFDNTGVGQGGASNTLIVFSEPMHDLAVSGTLTIDSFGVNYAYVSGMGILTGKKYTHNTNVLVINRSGNDSPNTKKVTDNHLISFANSNNVARRVLDFYSSARTLKAKIMLQGEKPGQNLALKNAFGEPSMAFLEKMTVSVTSVIGASCELIENFTPTAGGNAFENRAFISTSGTWQVPAGVNLIRIVLIGGGQGGSGGFDGENGTAFSEFTQDPAEPEPGSGYAIGYTSQRTPAGGASGDPGTPGRYAIYDKAVTPGEVITLAIGQGGAGGARNGGIGADGGNTTASSSSIGALSSEDGISSDAGYYDVSVQQAFAITGVAGYKGGDGGLSDAETLVAIAGAAGLAGGNVSTWTGGSGGSALRRHMGPDTYTYTSRASGGGGGGAAYGANGNPGGAASFVARHQYEEPSWQYPDGLWVGDRLNSGLGGNGANASAPPQASYGNGGQGGNGGGAGGNGGGVSGWWGGYVDSPSCEVNDSYVYGRPYVQATGGQGSAGGKGGNGCVIIYY